VLLQDPDDLFLGKPAASHRLSPSSGNRLTSNRGTFRGAGHGDVLRGLQHKGVDLEKLRKIEFYCYAKNKSVAHEIVDRLNPLGFNSDIHEHNEETDQNERFSVYSACQMIPSYEEIVRIQADLNAILAEFDTRCDGWGTLVDPEELQPT
jgi:regulator of RNase E activity RraB